MLNANNLDLSFKTTAEIEAFCSWYLGATVNQVRNEFQGDDALWLEFITRRDRRLKVHLDDLKNLGFDSAIPCAIEGKSYFKIVNATHKNPLSSTGSDKKSSRFNYKNHEKLKNRVIYFGQDQACCHAEMFHLDVQQANYVELTKRTDDQMRDELPLPKYLLLEYQVKAENILVLTGSPAYKALGVPVSVVTDEWYPINDEYEIPTASQILAAVVKKHKFNGILYTSVRSQTKFNLVLFEENTGELHFNELSRQPFDPKAL